MSAKVPFNDLYGQYLSIKADVDAAIADVIARSAFIRGPDVEAFETEFAAYCEAAACLGVGNGTDALHIALRTLGIGPGDEVITVANTFIATTEAIGLCGAKPVFVDIRNDTMLMDPDLLEAAVTSRTKAIVPVHLFGQACDMDAILDVARRHGLKVVEDAAQAHGARWRGKRVGTFGDLACFSFFPGKNLGAMGDGGAIVGNDRNLVDIARMISNHGRQDKYFHLREGVNSRLDGLHAAVLRVKLRHLDSWNAARRAVAAEYDSALRSPDLVLPVVRPECEPVWHLYVIRTAGRDQLQKRLKDRGIETGIHYPVPLHRQPAYGHLGLKEGSLPVTERIIPTILSLPIFPELVSGRVRQVADAIHDSVGAAIV